MEINRRTLVRTTAWTAPAVALTTAAPAFASTSSRPQGTLNWTFTASTSALAGGEFLTCSNLQLTFDNTKSTLDLVPTKVFAEANVFGTWQGVEQPNAEAIPAGTTHTMSVDTSSYNTFALRFTVTFIDAHGNEVSVPTTGDLKTGSCRTSATFTHTSTS